MLHLISIKESLLSKYREVDREVLRKTNRPVVLIVRLKYKGCNCDFAVPFRSNISPTTPRDQYFPLPNRSETKPYHHHGLHFIKMIPVDKRYYERYRIDGNSAATSYLMHIDKNEKIIVRRCQEYLIRYESGDRPPFSTNIDALIHQLETLQ